MDVAITCFCHSLQLILTSSPGQNTSLFHYHAKDNQQNCQSKVVFELPTLLVSVSEGAVVQQPRYTMQSTNFAANPERPRQCCQQPNWHRNWGSLTRCFVSNAELSRMRSSFIRSIDCVTKVCKMKKECLTSCWFCLMMVCLVTTVDMGPGRFSSLFYDVGICQKSFWAGGY